MILPKYKIHIRSKIYKLEVIRGKFGTFISETVLCLHQEFGSRLVLAVAWSDYMVLAELRL